MTRSSRAGGLLTLIPELFLGPQMVLDLFHLVPSGRVRGQHLLDEREREAFNAVPGRNLVLLFRPVHV